MKLKIITLLMFICSFGFSQNVHEIIQKNLENTGGIQNWENLKNIELKGEIIFGLEEKYQIEIYQKNPNLSKTFYTINKKKRIIEGYDGIKSYALNFANNKLEYIKNSNPESFQSDLLNYQKKGFKADFISKEKVVNKECYKISLTKNSNTTFYYFDVSTYFLLKEENKEEQTFYDNFKSVGNLKIPHKMEIVNKKDKNNIVLFFYKININIDLKDSFFKL